MQYFPWGLSDLSKITVLDDPIAPTAVKYAASSGLPDWEGVVAGELSRNGVPNIADAASVAIGNTVTGVAADAFDNCASLTSVTIPGSVGVVGNGAFFGCRALASVAIGEGVETIDLGAFTDCRALNDVTIPSSVTSIGDDAFFNCDALRDVTFVGKDRATVQGMSRYPWALQAGCVLHCSDGDAVV